MKHRPTSRRRRTTKSVLRLLDLEHGKTAVSLHRTRSEDIVMRSTNSLIGIARNRAWRSTESSSFATALISNRVNSPQGLSIYAWVLCAVSLMRQPIVVC